MQNTVLAIVLIFVFAAALMFSQFVYWWLQSRQQVQARELSRRLGTLVDKSTAPLLLRGPATRSGQKGFAARMEDLLGQAGFPYPLETLYARMAMAGAGGAIAAFAVFRGAAGVIGLAAAYLPVLLLSSQAAERARRLTEQLPDGLDLLARSMQAGHGISEAMRAVAEELPLPLAQEFGRVYEENNLGRDFRDCLASLTVRNPKSFDLQIFVSSVLLQRETGGNLVEILNNISGTIRQRFVFQGKVRALTSEARFTAYILGGLPFAIGTLISLVQPQYLQPLFHDPLGTLMLLYAAFSFSLGVFLMRETSKVEV
jgi:tight adherence protein B